MGIWQFAVDAVVVIASVLAILEYFGIKPRGGISMPLSQKWKLSIMLGLVGISLALSGYSLYRYARPKIVEKIVEKPVPVPCPDKPAPEVTPLPNPKPPKSKGSIVTNPIPQSQSCPNGICIGGDNSGNPNVTNNYGPPPASVSWQLIKELNTKGMATRWDTDEMRNAIANPGVLIEVSVDRSLSTAVFRAICDRPCVSIQAYPNGTNSVAEWEAGVGGGSRSAVVRIFQPAILTPDVKVAWEIRSSDGVPIHIQDVQIMRVP